MKFRIGDFLSEFFLYSGQYAIFYILMNFSEAGMEYFEYTAHVVLIFALFIQTFILYKYGDNTWVRLFGSLICPFIYTLFELNEFREFIANIVHLFFWVFSLIIGILNVLKVKSKKLVRTIIEFITVFTSIVIFIFIYMYFDISLEQIELGATHIDEYNSRLSILNISKEIKLFLMSKPHIYITLGGVLLGISLGMSQVKILNLKEKINDLFGKYIDDSIRDKLIENNGIYKEKRELCILFSDIRNFTAISENLEASIVVEALNEYFTMWEKIASEHNGVINKYIGDAIMIIFGLNDKGNQEVEATKCSIKVLESLEDLNNKLMKNNLVEFKNIGIGIHCGELVLGNVGSENRKEFTVIGDVVNTASRLESYTKLINGNMAISKDVYDRLESKLKDKFKYIDSTVLKGKESGVEVYKLIEK